MKHHRLIGILLAIIILSGATLVGQRTAPAASKMANAAAKLLAALDDSQKSQATFAFDDQERLNWHFIPLQDRNRKSTRKGLPLEAMSDAQKKAALALLKSGTSSTGYQKAAAIISLEGLLAELEPGGSMVRSPEWYFVSIFGIPSEKGKWGWRFEGHHLSLNYVIENGQVVSATPSFFGANPATVKSGTKKGQRALPLVEDLAWKLVKSMSDSQKKAIIQPKQFPEVAGRTATLDIDKPVGLPAGEMDDTQKATLMQLVTAHTDRLPAEVGAAELAEIKSAGFENIYFAFAGGLEPGQPHTYRLHGPSFVAEFLNVQGDSARNPANHVHSCWRSTATK